MTRMSTATHGIIDYITSGMMALLPKLAGFSPKATVLVESAAGSAAVYSAMTDYEYGVVKVLPMKAHLTLDALSGGMLLGAALMMDDEDSATRATLAGLGIFEIFAAVSTQTTSMNERGRRGGERSRPRRGGARRRQLQNA
jgi:hypothetical protein